MRHEILRMLENNSRIDLHDLAIMLGTDESVVLEEIEKMENEGIICGYPTLINWDKTDTEKVTAFIEVRVTPQRGQGFEKLAERITNYPEVKSIYLMSGAFDFAISGIIAASNCISPSIAKSGAFSFASSVAILTLSTSSAFALPFVE